MKKNSCIGIIILLLCVVLMISGCTEQSPSNNNNNSSTDDSSDNSTTQPSNEAVRALLEKAESTDSVYFEVYITSTAPMVGTHMMTTKVWEKNQFLKEDSIASRDGEDVLETVIIRPNGSYRYNQETASYTLATDITLPQQSLKEMARDLLNNYTLTANGTEVYEGKTTTTVEYEQVIDGITMKVTMRIWNDYGVPLTIFKHGTADWATVTMTYSYSKYSFADIPDSTFSVT